MTKIALGPQLMLLITNNIRTYLKFKFIIDFHIISEFIIICLVKFKIKILS